jgi:uncharacterized Tic20 family protein
MAAKSGSSKTSKRQSTAASKSKATQKAAEPKPPTAEQVSPPAPMPLRPDEERTWAMLAHLSVLLNLVTGFLGVVAALLVYLVYQSRSRYVAYHALQSLVFQLIVWIGGATIVAGTWIVTGVLSAFLVGILCVPIAMLISAFPFVSMIYGIIGGVECSQGRDFRYWLVGDWVRGTLTG